MREVRSIATIASHSALQILRGAKSEGFKTIVLCPRDRVSLYSRFLNFIDDIVLIDGMGDVCSDEAIRRLNEEGAVIVPHGSFVEYIGVEGLERLDVPIFGNRRLMIWEADQFLKMRMLERSGVKVPRVFRSPEEVDRLVIVKMHGAKGGRGYFLARSPEEVISKCKSLGISPDECIIQEFVIGTPMYFQYFNSVVMKRLELLGCDIRYESDVDGLRRVPVPYADSLSEPTFTVVGNIPLVVRESLLVKVFEYGEGFVRAAEELVPPGVIGPFCLEGVCRSDLEIVIFEFSGRIVAGTNLYINGSPYSWLYFDEPMSMGRRIAREIRMAEEHGMLDKVLT